MRNLSNRYQEVVTEGGQGQIGVQFFPEAETEGVDQNETAVHHRVIDPSLAGLGHIISETIEVEESKE